ncbi:phosphoadenosine phosphosulfate reductase family protein [Nonomuraea maheshkhaliensis]|uniref:phosphoadenosine phosphosulfate reductase domain-containing protein n=1 Tax=Nonomuraea maheshkhaliensis TaxID=419590 RepID=UPI0031F93A01
MPAIPACLALLPRQLSVTLKKVAPGPTFPVSMPRFRYGNGWLSVALTTIEPSHELVPNLTLMDDINVNHSGGKDSRVMARYMCELARAAGVLDRVTILHNDLGMVEWPGTAELDAQYADYYRATFGATLVELFGDRPSAKDLARQDAELYGVPFVVRSRMLKDGTPGDLIQQIEQYGAFPDAARRHCTSEQKRAPKHADFTRRVRERALGRKMLILDVNGERGDESTARMKKAPFEYNRVASNKTKRSVWTWRPLHDWTLSDIWDYHAEHGIERHWWYDAGGGRLSCSICVLGSNIDITLACLYRPNLAQRYRGLEVTTGHLFKHRRSIRHYIDAAARLTADDIHAHIRAASLPTPAPTTAGGCSSAS